MTDAIFFFKAMPPKDLPEGVKGIALDPPSSCMCGGSDPRCSSAYSCLWQSLKDASGRVTPTLRKKYDIDGRIAFAPFSAGHGFVNPLLNNDADRADTSAVLLYDATFGGGKTGYVKAAQDAAAGRLLLVSATSDKGSTDALSNGDYAWRQFVLKPAGLNPSPSSFNAPMPAPSGGVFQAGNLWYYRYSHAELPHTSMGKLISPLVQAHLLPFWSGSSSSGFPWKWALGLLVAVGGWYAWRRRNQ